MPIEQVGKKLGDSGVKLPLDNPLIISALQKGNIQDVHKLLADYGLTVGDFEEFLKQRFGEYHALLQEDPVTSQETAVPQPDFEQDFLPQDPANYMSDSDVQYASDALTKTIGGGKAGGAAPKAGGKAVAPDTAAMNADVDEWNQFYDGVLAPKIFEMQFMQQLEAKSAELEQELQRVLAMAKSGEYDVSTVIVYLAKVNMEKNGIIYAHLGEKVLKRNEQINAINDSLRGGGVDPASLTAASTDMRNLGQGLQFIIGDMQKVVQNSESSLTSAKSLLDITNEMKRKITDNIKS